MLKRIIKANPVGFALVIVFLLLILVGVVTTKGAERRTQRSQHDGSVGMLAPRLAAETA